MINNTPTLPARDSKEGLTHSGIKERPLHSISEDLQTAFQKTVRVTFNYFTLSLSLLMKKTHNFLSCQQCYNSPSSETSFRFLPLCLVLLLFLLLQLKHSGPYFLYYIVPWKQHNTPLNIIKLHNSSQDFFANLKYQNTHNVLLPEDIWFSFI